MTRVMQLIYCLLLAPPIAAFSQVRPFSDQFKVVRDADGLDQYQYVKSTSDDKSGDRAGMLDSVIPHPYLFGNLSLNPPNGYRIFSQTAGTGFNINSAHIIVFAEFAVNNARKADSGTGHGSAAKARFFYRIGGGWYVGGGGQWTKVDTKIYTKSSWHPSVGVGRDLFKKGYSLRAQALYVFPGSDHLNGAQGPELSLWLPSPSNNRHWFYRETVGIYESHQTAAPGNPGTANRSVGTYLDFGVFYRF